MRAVRFEMGGERRRSSPPGCHRAPSPAPAVTLLEDGLELELAADGCVGLHDLEAGHGVVVDVAVGIEAPLAVDALEVLGGGDGLAQGFALLGRILALLDSAGSALRAV